MDEMPAVIAVRTFDGDIDVHYANPFVTIAVDGSAVIAFTEEEEFAWVDVYEEGDNNYREFGQATFYRVIRDYTNRRRNTDKRLGFIGG
jgi:hypothetical protein